MAMTLGRGCTFAILIEFDKNCVLFFKNGVTPRSRGVFRPSFASQAGSAAMWNPFARAGVLPLGPGRRPVIRVHLPVGRQVQFVPKRSALTQHPLPQTAHHELCPSRKV
ncbi:hypothetical protein ABIA85_003628 [Bradyrhizobium sp. LA6.10]|uniref:hypothetical protein n=1 Tax=Bradyrhizobium sp. LA6.10 TaxID=3156318 RepID=UPI00339422D1